MRIQSRPVCKCQIGATVSQNWSVILYKMPPIPTCSLDILNLMIRMKTLCSPLWWLLCKFENGAMVVAGSWKAALYCGSVFVINYLAFLCPCSAADLILEFINFHINTTCWIESAILIAAAFLVDEKLLLWLKANTHGRIGTPVRNNLEITSYPVEKKNE